MAACRKRYPLPGKWARKAPLLYLPQNDAQRAAFSLDHGYLCLSRYRQRFRYLLSRAGSDAQLVQAASGRVKDYIAIPKLTVSIFAYLDDRATWRTG